MSWEEFKTINGTLPTLLYPAFRFQHVMRVKVGSTTHAIMFQFVQLLYILC
jgi:hypothetical protein